MRVVWPRPDTRDTLEDAAHYLYMTNFCHRLDSIFAVSRLATKKPEEMAHRDRRTPEGARQAS